MPTVGKPDPSYFPPLVTSTGTEIPFAQLVDVDPDNLTTEMETHASWQAAIAFAHAAAKTEVEAYERAFKRQESALSFTLRTSMERELKIKPTVDAIDRALQCDEGLQKMEDKLLDLRRKERELDVARRAMDARRDMLVNLSAGQRAEMKLVS